MCEERRGLTVLGEEIGGRERKDMGGTPYDKWRVNHVYNRVEVQNSN